MAKIIDDFSSGAHDVTIKSGSDANYQTGESILGGYRYTALSFGLNLQDQPAHLDILKDCLNLNVGIAQYLRLDVGYGMQPDGNATLSRKGVGDFKSMGTAFRVNFRFTDTMPVNINIVVYTETGYASYAKSPDNSAFTPYTPLYVDAKFDEFRGADQADFSKVGLVLFIFDTWADFAIDSIEII